MYNFYVRKISNETDFENTTVSHNISEPEAYYLSLTGSMALNTFIKTNDCMKY